MRVLQTRLLMTVTLATAACITLNARSAEAADLFEGAGVVQFENLQATLGFAGENSPYIAIGDSPLLGVHVQTGSILPLAETLDFSEINEGRIKFCGVQGPHPIPGQGNVHIIHAEGGKIFCTWKAAFTIQFVNAAGDAILTGNGEFTITGGTGRFRNATGSFQTLFQTDIVPAGADSAIADYTQDGLICR